MRVQQERGLVLFGEIVSMEQFTYDIQSQLSKW